MREGHILINGLTIIENTIVSAGENICYTMPDYQEADVDTRWAVLWSNHEIAAIHKPANLPVNRTTRNVYNTLIQLLRRESLWPDAHLLHRLDLETSGVLLIAHNNAVARKYQSSLPSLIKRKIYHAVVTGEPEWEIKEYCCDLATTPESDIRCKMHVVPEGEGKKSVSHFKVLERYSGYTLIQCELKTGRKHQIRAQLARLGHPIVGDKIYNHDGDMYLKRLNIPLDENDYSVLLTEHHLLHAYEIQLNHIACESDKDIIIKDRELPEEWARFIQTILSENT